MILYPAIDIMGGRAVRLRQGNFEDSTTYHDDPLVAAQSWVEAGARFLHVVDLDGARSGEPKSIEHLRRIVQGTGVPVQYGGDPPQMLERPRLARLGAVEVDDVEDARARVHPAPGGLERVVVVDGAVLEAALDEAHRLPLEDVDGRVEDHAATRAQTAVKLRSSASPSREDFSGWNCTPDTVPRSTIEAKRSPYSATPTTSAGSAGRQANECTW